MINVYDIAYGLAIGASAPFWLLISSARHKVRRALAQRMGHVPQRPGHAPAVMIHAVSLGEINAARGLVDRLRRLRPDLHLIISTTTETGFARAQQLYAQPDVTLIRYPLDFTSPVNRVLDRLRPSVVVLMELETWPNFLLQCSRRGIPVLLVNGRITDPSFRRYRWALPVVRRMFRRLASLCVQEQTYADRLIALGAPPDRVTVTGTMKFDTAVLADRVDGDAALAADLLLHPAALPSAQHSALSTQHFIWVCGSTGPGEEQLILQQYRALLAHCPTLLLVIVPRKPERFDQVAGIITAAGFDLVRRSSPPSALGDRRSAPLVILGDTMGELPKFYSLADVVFVGRTLVDLGPRQHGSDMIEPAALGKPVIVGPFTGNFADAMSRFRAAQAIIEVQTADELAHAVRRLLSSPQEARALADRARQVVNQEKGATERHVQTILSHLK